MKLLWLGAVEHRNILFPSAELIPSTELLLDVSDAESAVVIEANCGDGARAERHGLRWLQRLRYEGSSVIPALVYSPERLQTLARQFPIVGDQVPGTSFLQVPFTLAEFRDSLGALMPLSPEELIEVVRWRCGLQDEWARKAHDLRAAVADWPAQAITARCILRDWERSVRLFAADQIRAIELLKSTLSGSVPEMLAALQTLDIGLQSGSQGPSDVPVAPFRRPPRGYDSIAIADDQGYEPATIECLRRMGYLVFEPAPTVQAVYSLLRNARPRILLADLNFPLPSNGLEIMRAGLSSKSVRLVIAVSHSRVPAGTLPDGVVDCSGACDFADAERIHRVIWQRAISQGIDHAA